MSELLTKDEYRAIARELSLPASGFVDGSFRPARSGRVFESLNPATGALFNRISAYDEDDVGFAVAKARESFETGTWSRRAPGDRKSTLLALAKLLERNRHELAVLESLESGKPIRDCERVDIPETIHCLRWHAEAIDKVYDQVAPVGDDALAMVVREAVGVVACVLPWNFPLLMMAWKIAPALGAGNSVIVKPAEQTSTSALRVAELAMEAGLPKGVLNVVTGGGTTGEALGRHPDVDVVSFTGSTEVGRKFLRYSADSNLKRVVLECGGKNPCVVLDDAEDLDLVAEHVLNAAFWNMGENCSANSRLIVQRPVKAALMERILARARDWRTGDPLDPVNDLGAIISREQFEKIAGFLKTGRSEGAKPVLGGDPLATDAGWFIPPTIFDEVSTEAAIAREEIFGPVLAVLTVDSMDEAIRVANDTDYGLAASVFTANVKRAHRAARDLRAGTVTVNCYGEGDITTPFGGYKRSGFGGRDNSLHAYEQYTELKTIWLDLSDRVSEDARD